MSQPIPLQHDGVYHIYNRGNNREDLFVERRNYPYFLQLYIRHVHPAVETYAYCLLRNHFHLLIRVKPEADVPNKPSRYFANWFSAYAKAFNRAYGRSGSLFERPFERSEVRDEAHFAALVIYIHFNPVRHGFVDTPSDWPHSSYHAFVTDRPTRLRRDVVLDWFGGRDAFVNAHAVEFADLELDLDPGLSGLRSDPG